MSDLVFKLSPSLEISGQVGHECHGVATGTGAICYPGILVYFGSSQSSLPIHYACLTCLHSLLGMSDPKVCSKETSGCAVAEITSNTIGTDQCSLTNQSYAKNQRQFLHHPAIPCLMNTTKRNLHSRGRNLKPRK